MHFSAKLALFGTKLALFGKTPFGVLTARRGTSSSEHRGEVSSFLRCESREEMANAPEHCPQRRIPERGQCEEAGAEGGGRWVPRTFARSYRFLLALCYRTLVNDILGLLVSLCYRTLVTDVFASFVYFCQKCRVLPPEFTVLCTLCATAR